MQRPLLALALIALTASALAQSPPPGNGIPGNTRSPMTSEPHPASGAHAIAVAGQANATRIEACAQLANGFLDDLGKGHFKTAASNFNGSMRKAGVSADKLAKIWQSLGARFGKLESRGDPQAMMYQNMPVVSTLLHFAKGSFVSQLACDSKGKIAGLYIRPIPPGPVPATSSQ